MEDEDDRCDPRRHFDGGNVLPPAAEAQSPPAAWWQCNEGKDEIRGNSQYLPGVRGTALKFDGFYEFFKEPLWCMQRFYNAPILPLQAQEIPA
ncbi:MAG: hypothetical protein ACYS74_05390 [Planctomycetota bacterium]|jgi:hypothetical protein